jgi:trigger factor
MKSAVETLTPTRVKLTVEVPFDELQPAMSEAYKKIGQQIRVKGFLARCRRA